MPCRIALTHAGDESDPFAALADLSRVLRLMDGSADADDDALESDRLWSDVGARGHGTVVKAISVGVAAKTAPVPPGGRGGAQRNFAVLA